MGRVLGPYGVAGWLKVEVFTEAPGALVEYAQWWLRPPGASQWLAFTCTEGRVHGDVLIVRLAGFNDREQAFAVRGCEIGVPRSALPAPAGDEVYWADLVGCAVSNRKGEVLGMVEAVTAHGAHPLLQVRSPGDGAQRLIPYVPAVVDAVDVAARRIEVDWGVDY